MNTALVVHHQSPGTIIPTGPIRPGRPTASAKAPAARSAPGSRPQRQAKTVAI